ncbi:UNVERIFIED_CONTAM: putative mitochondrial protein [Sesamum latifolium]|uniref:Mitochondrial protein n=1 Tax=Sesamum latifolium TaxID=2727402 RepID=A0AAW2WWG2_9LAMI
MVKEGIVLGHKVSYRGIEVDKAKVDLIAKSPPPQSVKEEGCENTVADHLSRLNLDYVENMHDFPLRDEFPNEHLCAITQTREPWFADFANFLVGNVLPSQLSYQQKKKFFSDIKYYLWDEPYLYKWCGDGMVRRCVPEEEMQSILGFCHDREVGGHHGGAKTAAKVLQCGFYWPSLFKDAHKYVSSCDQCQRTEPAADTRSRRRRAVAATTRLAPLLLPFRREEAVAVYRSPRCCSVATAHTSRRHCSVPLRPHTVAVTSLMEQPGPSRSHRRLSKNTVTLPPADTDLGGHLHFCSQRHHDRYFIISQCVILPEVLLGNHRQPSPNSRAYDSSKTKDTYIRDLALKYLHRFLAYTFSGRKDSSTALNKTELFFLWSMLTHTRINIGFWVASQFQINDLSEPGAPLDRRQREASPRTDEDPTPLTSETVHDRFDSFDERLRCMELNLHAYFEFMQFQPPFPPPP